MGTGEEGSCALSVSFSLLLSRSSLDGDLAETHAATTKRRGTGRSDAAAKCAAYPRRYFPSVEIGQACCLRAGIEKNIRRVIPARDDSATFAFASERIHAGTRSCGKAVIKAASSCSSSLVYSARDLFTRTRTSRRIACNARSKSPQEFAPRQVRVFVNLVISSVRLHINMRTWIDRRRLSETVQE